MKTFLFSFNIGQIDAKIIGNKLNGAPEISDWLLLTTGLLLVRSELPVDELASRIHYSFPGMQFIVTNVTPETCEGWMPQPVWDFINQRQRQAIPA